MVHSIGFPRPLIFGNHSVKSTIEDWFRRAAAVTEPSSIAENLCRLENSLELIEDVDDWGLRAEEIRLSLEEPEASIDEVLIRAHGFFTDLAKNRALVRKLASDPATLQRLGIAGSNPPPEISEFCASAERLRLLVKGGEGVKTPEIGLRIRNILHLLVGMEADLRILIAFEYSSHSDRYSLAEDLDSAEAASFRVWWALHGALSVIGESEVPKGFSDQLEVTEELARVLMQATRSNRVTLSEHISERRPLSPEESHDDLRIISEDEGTEDERSTSFLVEQLNLALRIFLEAWAPRLPD